MTTKALETNTGVIQGPGGENAACTADNGSIYAYLKTRDMFKYATACLEAASIRTSKLCDFDGMIKTAKIFLRATTD